MKNGEKNEETIERIVGNTVATEAFEYLTVTDREIEELKRLARGDITMEEFLKSGCDDERDKS